MTEIRKATGTKLKPIEEWKVEDLVTDGTRLVLIGMHELVSSSPDDEVTMSDRPS